LQNARNPQKIDFYLGLKEGQPVVIDKSEDLPSWEWAVLATAAPSDENDATTIIEDRPWSMSTDHANIMAREHSAPGAYLMFESIELTNFRGFESLKLTNLARFNIITGANASGKSALLESLVCGARANAETFLNLSQLRGISLIFPNTAPGLNFVLPQNFRAIWDHWFYLNRIDKEHRQAANLKIEYTDSKKESYCLAVGYPDETSAAIQVSAATGFAGPLQPVRISRYYTTNNGKTRNSAFADVVLTPQGVQSTREYPPLGPAIFLFPSTQMFSEAANIEWLSKLRESGRKSDVVSFIKKAFPFVKDLEILYLEGSPSVYADIGEGVLRRLQLLSSGINKIVSILLAAGNATGGILLIDEIENGLFYDKYGMVWDILYKFAKTFDFQIFVTSHSAECLEHIVPIMGDDTKDFLLIRTERDGDKCIARQISGASMRAALTRGAEIRGVTEVTPLMSAVGAEVGAED
jgi:hypothetical protein